MRPDAQPRHRLDTYKRQPHLALNLFLLKIGTHPKIKQIFHASHLCPLSSQTTLSSFLQRVFSATSLKQSYWSTLPTQISDCLNFTLDIELLLFLYFLVNFAGKVLDYSRPNLATELLRLCCRPFVSIRSMLAARAHSTRRASRAPPPRMPPNAEVSRGKLRQEFALQCLSMAHLHAAICFILLFTSRCINCDKYSVVVEIQVS